MQTSVEEDCPPACAEGRQVGSGPVEAACKTLVKTRLCRSGMQWSWKGGQRILQLRTYVKSKRWDAFWSQYKKFDMTVMNSLTMPMLHRQKIST